MVRFVARSFRSLVCCLKGNLRSWGVFPAICSQVMLCLLFLLAPGFAQNQSGVQMFSTNHFGVDLATGNVNINIPLRSKNGKIPFWSRLVGTSGMTVGPDGSQWFPMLLPGSPGWSYQDPTTAIFEYAGVPPGVRHCTYHSSTYEVDWFGMAAITDSSGASHTFAGNPKWQVGNGTTTTGCYTPQVSHGPYTTTDGSGYTLIITNGNPTVYDKSGRYLPGTCNIADGCSLNVGIYDPDGASISNVAGAVTDTLGTTVVSGAPNNPFGQSGFYNTVAANTPISYYDINGSQQQYTLGVNSLPIATNFNCINTSGSPDPKDYNWGTSSPLVTSVTMPGPNPGVYTIAYEQTTGGNYSGRIAKITFPSGGSISYSYGGGNNGINCNYHTVPIVTVQVNDNNGNIGTYTYTSNLSTAATASNFAFLPNFTVTEKTPPRPGKTTGDTITHYFSGEFETETVVQDVTLGTLTTTVTCYNKNYSSQANCIAPASVPVLPITQTDVYTYVGSSAAALTETTFDSNGNVTEIKKYGFGATYPPSGTPVSDTTISYGSWNGSSCSTFSNYIYDRPCVVGTSGSPASQTRYTYNSAGHPTQTSTLASGSTYLNSYATYNSPSGTALTTTDINGAVTTYGYSGNGACNNNVLATSATVTGAGLPSGGLETLTAWNCNGGVPTSTTDPNLKVTGYGYQTVGGTADPLWRMLSITDPLGNVTWSTYSPGSTVPPTQESNLPFNNNTSATDVVTTFDGLGRPIVKQTRQTPGSSNFDTISYTYDSNGRVATVSMPCVTTTVGQACPATPATTTSYDAAGRPLSVTDGGDGTTNYSYVANDVLQTVGPEHPSSRQMEYDGLGRLASVCEVTGVTGSNPCGQASPQTGYVTSYSYDALGNLAVVTQNAAGSQQETRNYGYDGLSRLTSESNPETGGKTYTYDVDSTCGTYTGDQVKRTDAAGNTTCYSYDALHRMTSTTYSGTNATPNKYFVYDAATVNGVAMANATGRMAEAYTGSSSSKITDLGFVYSPRGEDIEIWESTPNSGGYYHPTAGSGYWANGTLQTLWMSGLPTLSYGADGEGRTWSVSASSGQNPVTATLYDAASRVKGVTFGSGDSDALTFDSNTGRMKQYQFNVNGSAQTGTLGWNANGTLLSLGIVDPFNAGNAQNCTYGYDDLARLGSVTCTPSIWSQSFTYDAFGNASKSGNSSWQPNYNTKNQYQSIPGFPNPGPTYDANGDILTDSFHTYTWDAEGHVTAIDSIGLTYDALGRQVEQNQSGTYFQIVYSPMGSKLAVMKGQTIQQAFVPLPGGTTAEYLSWGLSHYRHPDWLGSERLESGTGRNIIQDTAYAPFGEPYAELSGGNGELSFTGQNKDTDWLNYDFIYREYDPRQGRWISPDPSGIAAVDPSNPQSWNRYVYALNNPLSSVDPTGLFCVWDDGSYDSASDPGTGNASSCGADGGNWFEGNPSDWGLNADWSSQANANFADQWLNQQPEFSLQIQVNAPMMSNQQIMADMIPGGRGMLNLNGWGEPLNDLAGRAVRFLDPCGGNPNVACGVVFPVGGGNFGEDLMASRPPWAASPGGFVNWLKNLQKAGMTLTAEQADTVVAEAKSLGVEVRLDPPHPGSDWDVPHLNIGNKGQVHLEVPPGYSNPGVAQGHP